MKKTSKRYQKAREKVSSRVSYTLEEAIAKLQEMPSPKFDETVEISAKLLVDPRQSNQMVRGTVDLPHGSGKKVRILVFTENPEEALEAGADYAGLDDMIQKIQDGWMDFDVAIATPEAMKEVRKIARILGPRGLMPNPKSGTVTDQVKAGVEQVKSGRIEFKMDKTGNVHIVCGKRSFSRDQLLANVEKTVESLKQARPENLRGRFIKNLTLSATMSPGLRINSELYSSL